MVSASMGINALLLMVNRMSEMKPMMMDKWTRCQCHKTKTWACSSSQTWIWWASNSTWCNKTNHRWTSHLKTSRCLWTLCFKMPCRTGKVKIWTIRLAWAKWPRCSRCPLEWWLTATRCKPLLWHRCSLRLLGVRTKWWAISWINLQLMVPKSLITMSELYNGQKVTIEVSGTACKNLIIITTGTVSIYHTVLLY